MFLIGAKNKQKNRHIQNFCQNLDVYYREVELHYMSSRRQESKIDKNLKNKFNMPGEAKATPPSICFGEEGKKDFRQMVSYFLVLLRFTF